MNRLIEQVIKQRKVLVRDKKDLWVEPEYVLASIHVKLASYRGISLLRILQKVYERGIILRWIEEECRKCKGKLVMRGVKGHFRF